MRIKILSLLNKLENINKNKKYTLLKITFPKFNNFYSIKFAIQHHIYKSKSID
jgi:hypothetical protein